MGHALETAPEPARTCIVAPIQALMQAVPTPESLDRNALSLRVGQVIAPAKIAAWLTERGFTRLDQVEQAGDFALRGGILDLFASVAVDPVRFEFFGDEIESIRTFDLATQRRAHDLRETRIALPPKSGDHNAAATTSFLNYLPRDTLVVIHEPPDVQEMGRTLLGRLGDAVGMFPVEAVLRQAAAFPVIHMGRFESAAVEATGCFAVRTESLPEFEAKAADAVTQLLDLARGQRVIVLCDNDGERQRLQELIEQVRSAGPCRPLDVVIGWVRQGFVWRGERGSGFGVQGPGEGSAAKRAIADGETLNPESRTLNPAPLTLNPDPWTLDSSADPASITRHALSNFALIPHHDLFHRERRRRRIARVAAARPIESFLDLQPGDYVVHIMHGIGKYLGLKTLRKGDRGKTEEFLALQFADDAVLHVPATQIDLVQKYVGTGKALPPLSTLGGTRWKAAKARVEEAVTDFATELLQVQAQRESREGIAFPSDTAWQREFDASFVFPETPDQTTASSAIKRDMGNLRPMDRLLCGDVGYGKTELAMRAAFKAVEYGKQAAVLVPTTVLAEQHYRSFKERMAEYPFTVERVSRFRSQREMTDILNRARKGQVDILIGTHRLLSKDVRFADLGLVVIDEEQRFGVEHKERLKHLRSEVDVLTLTATPIPRTLHMAMVGLRDISALETPPLDRRSIQTRVVPWDDKLIREAIVRELNRDGQVYFVHNRVHSIEKIAHRIGTIVPEARLLIGHGQMNGDELEDVMTRFIHRQADVLVCTTIIESGIDIPTANTIIIDRADIFGLADLHQLRGRVGRYKHRAYCYLLLPDRPLTPTAARRLKAIEEFSDLGSGFRIAMRDLEIRGAGNILGPQQSGHITAVGYELYCKLLETAVRRMKGQPPDIAPDCHLELDLEAYVPKSYAPSERQRMEIYRRITACRTPADVEQIEKDLLDAYGKPPSQLETLLTLADLRVRAIPWKVRLIQKKPPDIIFKVDDIRLAEKMFRGTQGSIRIADPQTLHWRVPDNYFTPTTMVTILRRLFSKPH